MDYICGEDRDQLIMMPDCLDDYVDTNNAVRVIDAFVHSLNMSDMGFTKATLKETGRPPYSPKDLLKLYIYGYMHRIRSSRALEAETKRNIEVIWLMRKLSPDYKTIARFRQENPEALKKVFRRFVQLCLKADLYGAQLLAIDGSKFKACNAKDRAFTKDKLTNRISRIDKKSEEHLQMMDAIDKDENNKTKEQDKAHIAAVIAGLQERKEEYQGYLFELDETNETQKVLTDPDSRLMPNNGRMDVCYNVQTAVDSKNKMIVEFEVTNHPADQNQLGPMTEKAAETLGTSNFTALADAGYESASDIAKCLQNGTQAHVATVDIDICIPCDEEEASPILSHTNGRCVYLSDRNIAICPMGNVLHPKHYRKKDRTAVFHNSKVCATCKHKCTTGEYKKFQITMKQEDFTKEYNDENLWVRRVHVRQNKELMAQRKSIVEHPFGTVKRNMGFDHCLMKGIEKVRGEFAVTFLAYNLKRAINIMGVPELIQIVRKYA